MRSCAPRLVLSHETGNVEEPCFVLTETRKILVIHENIGQARVTFQFPKGQRKEPRSASGLGCHKRPQSYIILPFRHPLRHTQRRVCQTAEFQDFVVRSVVNLRTTADSPRGTHKIAAVEKALCTELNSNVRGCR